MDSNFSEWELDRIIVLLAEMKVFLVNADNMRQKLKNTLYTRGDSAMGRIQKANQELQNSIEGVCDLGLAVSRELEYDEESKRDWDLNPENVPDFSGHVSRRN